MKKLISLTLALVMLLTITACAKKPGTDTTSGSDTGSADISYSQDNMVENHDFASPDDMLWGLYTESQGEGSVYIGDGALKLDVANPGTCSWAVQAYYDGVSLTEGAEYMFRFDISCTKPKDIDAIIQINGGDYHPYISQTISLTPETQTIEIPFTMEFPSDKAPRVCFNCGIQDEEDPNALMGYTVTIDNVFVTCLTPGLEEEETETLNYVNLNQIGYRPGDTKIAIVRGDVKDMSFVLTDADGSEVYSGELTGKFDNKTADEVDYYADFSDFDTPGVYTLSTGDGFKSYGFTIGGDIYNKPFVDVIRMLYLQRCGCKLGSVLAGDFSHSECHTGEAVIYGTDDRIDVSGGWHDAGDYGRYVVSGAKAAMDLMLAYELNPDLYGDSSRISDSGNGIPDILDEVRYELDWMFKMQAEDGGVYHKVTCLNFPGVVKPEQETDQLYVMPVSTAATGDFAAVMAHASALFSDDSDFSEACLSAAVKAWQYLEKTPSDGKGFVNPSDVLTGEYPDAQDADERYWAAAELLAVTGDKAYSDYIDGAIAEVEASLSDDDDSNDIVLDYLGWANVGIYGSEAYLSADQKLTNPAARAKIEQALIESADSIVKLSESDGYFISMGDNYPWGSNMNIMNNAMIMIMANKYNPNEKYVYYAKQHLNYIFGANALGECFVTGCGTVSPVSTHHRPSQSAGVTMQGMLVGGVNSNLEDPYAKQVLESVAPAKCYVDNEQSYSCNEVCVYWNSPLIYVMAAECFDE